MRMAKKKPDSKALLRGLLETVNEGIVIFDTDDRLVLCNARYRALYAPIAEMFVVGVTSEAIYRAWGEKGLFDLRNGTVEAQIRERLEKHRNPEGPFELYTTERSLRIQEGITDDGYHMGTHTDITAWKRMERAFQDYEQQLPSTVRKTADRYWTMDANLRFTALVDYPSSSIIASPNYYIGHTRWEAVGVDPDRNKSWGKHRENLLARVPFEDFRYTSEDGFGGVYHMSVSGSPLFNNDGEFTGYHGTTTRVGTGNVKDAGGSDTVDD